MDETKQDTTSPAPASRPSDVEVFLQYLPNLVGSFAAKYNDARSASDLAIGVTRETVGSLAQIGFCEMTLRCRDGRPLALLPEGPAQPVAVPTFGAMPTMGSHNLGNGTNRQGAMVAQWSNQDVQKVTSLG
jgi:hypothetical protein